MRQRAKNLILDSGKGGKGVFKDFAEYGLARERAEVEKEIEALKNCSGGANSSLNGERDLNSISLSRSISSSPSPNFSTAAGYNTNFTTKTNSISANSTYNKFNNNFNNNKFNSTTVGFSPALKRRNIDSELHQAAQDEYRETVAAAEIRAKQAKLSMTPSERELA